MSTKVVIDYRDVNGHVSRATYDKEYVEAQESGVIFVTRDGMMVAAYGPRTWTELWIEHTP